MASLWGLSFYSKGCVGIKRVKILHLAYDAGGIHTRLYHDIITAYQEAGHEVVEVYLTGALPDNYVSPANEIHLLKFSPAELKGWRRLFVVRHLRAYIAGNNFKAIISHRRKPAELMARASRDLNIEKRLAVWHDEGEFKRWRNCFSAANLFRDCLLIGVSEAVRDDILASRAHFRAEQVVAINNAIDVDKLEQQLVERNAARKHFGIASDKFVFGIISRLVPKKGHADLIDAFALISQCHPQAELIIIGDGRIRDELEAQIKTLALHGSVRLLGAIPQAFRYAKAFDAFVLPSYREGLPIALLEAACARLPIIASDIGGNRAVLGDSGELIEVGNIAKLANAMKRSLEMNASSRDAQGEAIYRRLRERFDRPRMLHEYRELLED